MQRPGFSFQLHQVDPHCQARRSCFTTPHGKVEMPAFMPVGTLGTVKGLTMDQVRACGADMILGNTYHLQLRPGSELVAELGGLHQFVDWQGPILTDSGGFQLFSLAQRTKITEQGAVFRSHIDGAKLELTPERSIEIQENLGSDIAMVLDHVVALPADEATIRDAMERSVRWAQRCCDVARCQDQVLFGIVQGGLSESLRVQCAEQLAELDMPGYAIGGLSVGESPAEMYRVLDVTCPALPEDRPRYLMGVGRPEDLLEAIRRGVDMFDCVMPTRNGRNALAFTDAGPLRLRNRKYEKDSRPLDKNTGGYSSRLSRAYIRHLFQAGEMLGPILLSLHNLTYYQRLMRDARTAIENGSFEEFRRKKRLGWGLSPEPEQEQASP